MDTTSVETNLFDKVNIYTNCTVEILENSITGEISIGWYRTPATEHYDEGSVDIANGEIVF